MTSVSANSNIDDMNDPDLQRADAGDVKKSLN
jgi:hypothetical protein